MEDDFLKVLAECDQLLDKLLVLAQQSRDRQNAIIPRQIRKYRIMHDLTKDDLAEKVGVSRMELFRWESGKNVPSKMAKDKLKQLGVI